MGAEELQSLACSSLGSAGIGDSLGRVMLGEKNSRVKRAQAWAVQG